MEDLRREAEEHPLYDWFRQSKAADLSRIAIPTYIVASSTDQGLHTRGTLERFKQMSSKQKWLEVHGRKKWAYFYEPGSVRRQQAFFDRLLNVIENEVPAWPKVRLEVPSATTPARSVASEWPIARTAYTRLYLDARNSSLQREPFKVKASCPYEAAYDSNGRVRFDFRFERRTDLVGHMMLKMWMKPEGSDDMDVFVAVQRLDAKGEVVPFAFYAQFEDGRSRWDG